MSQHRGVSRQCQLILRTVPSRIDRTRREEKSRVEGRKFPTSSPSPSFSLERAISRIQLRSDQRDMWSTCRRRRKWKWAGDPSSSPEKPSHLFAISAHGRAIFPDFSFSFFFYRSIDNYSPIRYFHFTLLRRNSISPESFDGTRWTFPSIFYRVWRTASLPNAYPPFRMHGHT